MLLAALLAFAAEPDVYRAALRHVDERYLWPENIDHEAMFRAAADRAEARVEWLTVNESGTNAVLSSGRWKQTVRYTGDLPLALQQLEDGIRRAGLPLPENLDLRAELLTGALSTLDRHSVALAGESLDRFDERLSGTLTGIGVTLRLIDDHLVIIEVFPDSPAARGGLEANDVLLRLNGASTVGMTPSDATDRIRGRSGTALTVTVLRENREVEAKLVRAEVRIPNVTWSAGPRGVGVVHIDHFSEQTTANLEDAVSSLRAAGALTNGLVIDLRGNTGGSLMQSAKSADLFTNAGRIVMTAGRRGEKVPGLVREVEAKAGSQLYDGPIVVLVDRSTASGSEILAGALLQLDRAILIGEASFGKGTVQTIYQLAEGLKIKLTVAEYLLSGDVRVATVGLQPDLAMYPVEISESSVAYDELSRVQARIGASTPLYSWPRSEGRSKSTRDEPLEVAAALLESGVSADRESLLRALTALGPTLEAQTATRLSSALRQRGLDWSTEAFSLPTAPSAQVSLAAEATARAGQSVQLSAEVINTGPALERAALRLRSVNRAWDDVVLPIGSLAAGASAKASATVAIGADAPSRMDRVIIQLECGGCTSTEVLDTTLTVEGGPAPTVNLRSRLVDQTIEIEVKNTSSRLLSGARATIAYPKVEGVELLDAPIEHKAIPPNDSVVFQVPIRVDPGYTGRTLPLQVEVKADGFGSLLEWPLAIPVGGARVELGAPELSLKASKLHQAPGTATLVATASDADGLDHLVVTGGPQRVDRSRWTPSLKWDDEKLGYWGKLGKRSSQTITVPINPGTNRFEIVAVDLGGLRTTRTVYIYGDGEPPENDGVALDR